MNIYNNVLNNLDELRLEKIKRLADYLIVLNQRFAPLEILKDLTDMSLRQRKFVLLKL